MTARKTSSGADASPLEPMVASEAAELESAVKVPIADFQPSSTGSFGRCSWCGQYSANLVYVDTIHGIDRYKGKECCHVG